MNFRIQTFGVWNKFLGLEALKNKLELRTDLSGVHFRTTTLNSQPFTHVEYINKSFLPRGYLVISKKNCQLLAIYCLDKGG